MKTPCTSLLPIAAVAAVLLSGCSKPAPQHKSLTQSRPPTGKMWLDLEPITIHLEGVALSDALHMFYKIGGGKLLDVNQFSDIRVTVAIENMPRKAAAEQILAGAGFRLEPITEREGWEGWYDIVPMSNSATNGK